jgi:hypothetical protein
VQRRRARRDGEPFVFARECSASAGGCFPGAARVVTAAQDGEQVRYVAGEQDEARVQTAVEASRAAGEREHYAVGALHVAAA